MYRGVIVDLPEAYQGMIGLDRLRWQSDFGQDYLVLDSGSPGPEAGGNLILPLYSPENQVVHALAVLRFSKAVEVDEETGEMIEQMSVPLSVAVEREIIRRTMDMERQRFYEQAIRDPLTGLYTRVYMQESAKRLLDIHDRDANAAVAVMIFDLDLFKSVNDNYGHNAGDEVLRQVAGIILECTRSGDIQVRLGGEEFAVFIAGSDASLASNVAERIRERVEGMKIAGPMSSRSFSISGGIAYRRQGEELLEAIQRADKALYAAKTSGRNRIKLAEDG
ncbi:MAG: GGDEF domain-containing protein [Proteobacteria bacterium]|nr:GGDEF domain-containing protein [Pseudomonadota bacterium]